MHRCSWARLYLVQCQRVGLHLKIIRHGPYPRSGYLGSITTYGISLVGLSFKLRPPNYISYGLDLIEVFVRIKSYDLSLTEPYQ